jgi:hypothetical protein
MPRKLEEMIGFLEVLYNARKILLTKIEQQPDEHGQIMLFDKGSVKVSLTNKNDILEFDYTKRIPPKAIALNVTLTREEISITLTNQEAVTDLTVEKNSKNISISNGTSKASATTSVDSFADPSQNWDQEAKFSDEEASTLMDDVIAELVKEIPQVEDAVKEYCAKYDKKVHAFFKTVNTEFATKETRPSVNKDIEQIIKSYTR